MIGVERVRVGMIDDLTPGMRKVVKTELENILVSNLEGEFYAVSNRCPHAGGKMEFGPIEEDKYTIECPLHYWLFDIRSGKLLEKLEVGYNYDLNSYPVVVENGEIWLELPLED